MKTEEEKTKYIMQMMKLHEDIRNPYESMIDEIIKFVNHSRRKISDSDTQKGQKTGIDIYDGTALSALNLASDCIHGYLCSSSIHWFDLTLPVKMDFSRTAGMRSWIGKRLDEYPEVKIWLDECEEAMYWAYLKSNFYEFHPDYVKEGMSVGTATAIIEEDIKTGTVIFTLPHFRECYIAENNHGLVDSLYRKYKVSLRQLIQKYGAKTVFELDVNLKKSYENDPHQEVEIIHAVFPREDYDPSIVNGKNKPIASFCIYPNGQKKLIDESGFNELPSVTWRWRKNNDELYGRSPSWDCLIDIKKANKQAMTNLIAGEKMVRPPMFGHATMRNKINSNPGGWSWTDGTIKEDMPQPLITGIQLPFGIDQQERTDAAIKEHYYVSFFLMLYQAMMNKVELTATQTIGMQAEQAALLGTRIGRHQFEGLNRIMDRVFLIEARAGRLPQPPQILEEYVNEPISIEYLGPLSQSQKKLFKMQGIRAGLEMAAQVGQVFPDALDNIDGNILLKESLDSVSFPPICIRPEEKVEEIRLYRQQQEEEDRKLQQIEIAAKAGQRMTRKIDEGSLLDEVSRAESEDEEV